MPTTSPANMTSSYKTQWQMKATGIKYDNANKWIQQRQMVNMHKYAYETNMTKHCTRLQQEVCSSKRLRQQVSECNRQAQCIYSSNIHKHQHVWNQNEADIDIDNIDANEYQAVI